MNENPSRGDEIPPSEGPNPEPKATATGGPGPAPTPLKPSGKLDAWMFLDLVVQRWHWVVVGMLVSGALFYLLGWYVVKPKFTATAQLLRRETPGKSEYFKTAPLSAETFAGLMRSPELVQKVGDLLAPPVPHSTLVKWLKIDPEPDSDLVKVQVAARNPDYAVNLLNLYITNVVEYIRNEDARQAETLANDYLNKQLEKMNGDIKELEKQFREMPVAGFDTNRLQQIGGQVSAMSTNLAGRAGQPLGSFSLQAQRLQAAMDDLNKLLVNYTEEHPAVVAKQQYIRDLQKQMQSGAGTNQAMGAPMTEALSSPGARQSHDLDIITIKMRALEDAKVELAKRQLEAELYATNKPASVIVFAPAELKTVKTNMRGVKISVVTLFGGLLGLAASLGLVFLVEFMDNRLKTPEDLERVTRLPVLTTLGNLREMQPEERVQWAFRAWTMLQGRLSPSANHGLICGITSANSGEGRSTWISLLAEAASLSGFRVLTIATRPSPTHVGADDDLTREIAQELGSVRADGTPGGSSNALTTSVLSSPAKITEELTGPNSQPVVHIPLPGWVWNLERRKQWRDALSHWRQVDNLVILVELPPAKVPEAVLLGSNLPNMVWLADSGKADAGETRAHLETLRNARCNLVGAFLNRVNGVSLKYKFPRWVTAFGAIVAFATLSASAQETAPPSPATAPPENSPTSNPASATATGTGFSISRPSQRAAWQQHLTLGAGDVLTLNLFGQPELARAEVAIGPDGRLSYLEAQDVMAAGLTIDELRSRLDQELGKMRRSPRTIITPVTFKSKKYFVLGKVATKGVYVLDRPITLLEALARAHGFETAMVDRNIYDLTDMQHSFLARGGKRFPINFEKFFQRGDLSQNIAIEPDDYIYVAPGDVDEVYVVGEVRLPGAVTYKPDLSVVAAITARAGYTERAYKSRVLVVRGSLSQPEAIPVDTHAVLDGNGVDFKLKPRDIIYVNSRPFIRVEELADLAATAFIQSVITEAVGVDIVKPVQ